MTTEAAGLILDVLILLALLILVVLGLEDRERTLRLRRTVSVAIAAEPREPETAPQATVDRNAVLAPAPMLDGWTLRDWLIHQAGRDGVWSEVVHDFYTRAAGVPFVADYFRDVLARPQGREELERHFTRALLIVTHSGVTQRLVDAVGEKHGHVHNSHGQPITADVWDAVISTLVTVLRNHGVPERGINALGASIAPFRAALVKG